MGSRGSSMSYSSGKRWHYSTLLLLALGAAMLSVLVVHKLREGRVLGLLLHDRENQLFALQLILEKERAHSKEMKVKIEELKAKAASLRSHKMRLNTRLMEAENLAAHLKNKRTELELALQEKQTELITSLKDAEEASAKANKQQGGHARETDRRLQQPSNDQQANTALVGKEETAANMDEGAKEVLEKTDQHGRESKGGGWVRIETNTDDTEPVVDAGADHAESAKEESASEGAKQSEVAVDQVGDRSTPGEVISTGQKNGAEGGEQLPVMKDEVATADTSTETNVDVAPEDGKPEQKDNSADGEEKQTKEDPQTENLQHGESSKTEEKQADDQVIDGNVNSAEPAQLKLPENQTASAQAEAAGVQYSASSDGGESSEAKSTSTESYPDTNGSDEMTNGGEQQTVSDDKESNTSELGAAALHDDEVAGPENKEENNDVRSTMESTGEQSAASHEGQSENVHGGEEGESSGKEEDQLGSGQSGSEQPGEKTAGDEEKKSTGASTDLTQQQGANDTESAEEEASNNEAQQE